MILLRFPVACWTDVLHDDAQRDVETETRTLHTRK